MTEEKLRTVEEALAVLEKEYPRGVELIYIDYRDDLSESLNELNKSIQANDIYEGFESDSADWWGDSQYESIDYILKEQFTEEELENWGIDGRQDLQDWLTSHDNSNPTKDLLQNTGNKLCFYDTGLEIPEYPQGGTFNSDKFLARHAKRIAKKLKIDYTKHEKTLCSLVANASYGGQLVILFYCRPSDLFSDDKDNFIRFKGKVHLCISDRAQGSGDTEDVDDIVALPFNRQNLWIDAAAGGYTIDSVFGFYLPAFDYTPELFRIKNSRKPEATKLQEKKKVYDAWDADLKKGICHFNDPRYNSHDTVYRMDFPMGNKCKRCGRFFID